MVNKQALSNWLNRGKWDFVIPWWHVLITFHCSFIQRFLFFQIFIHLNTSNKGMCFFMWLYWIIMQGFGFYKWECVFVGLNVPYWCCRWAAFGWLATSSYNIFWCWLLPWRQWRLTINFSLQLLRGTTQKLFRQC